MSTKTKHIFYIRKFLNKEKYHSSAHILAEITKEISVYKDRKTKKIKKDFYRSASISISDCSRIINLDVDMDSKKMSKNSLTKLNVLIDTLTKFREVFIQEMEDMKND